MVGTATRARMGLDQEVGRSAAVRPPSDFTRRSARRPVMALFAAFVMAAAGPALGASYYVAPKGNDTNPGTIDQPWKTIQHAADTVVVGDTVFIRRGTYRERVIPQNSGAPGQEITYTAYPAERVVIDGKRVTLPADQAGLFEIAFQSYIRVSGLCVQNAQTDINSNGIFVRDSDHITIEKNYTSSTRSSGIGVWRCTNVVVDGNEVVKACTGPSQESISIAVTEDFEVRNNKVHDTIKKTDKEGICLKDGSKRGRVFGNVVYNVPAIGIYVDAWDKVTSDIDVYQNVVSGVTNGFGIAVASEMGGELSNIRIFNNIVYATVYIGIVVSRNGDEGGPHPMNGIRIVNNTVYNNGKTWGGGIAVDNPEAQNVLVRNNIVSANRSFQLSVSSDVPTGWATVDHNLIHGYRGDLADGEIYGDDYVEGDPLFLGVRKLNFRLQFGSPALDVGTPSEAPAADFDGVSRPQGGGTDIGAYER